MVGYQNILAFIRERERVRQAKERGDPFPWTTDSIISGNRFCNVRREDDRVTRWVATHWRNDDLDNWFAMAVVRLAINRIATMRDIVSIK